MDIQWGKLIAAIVICNLAGFIGAFFTTDSVRGWYSTIEKPSFNPPSWIFGPVWTTLYVLMGISVYLVWAQGFNAPGVKVAMLLFGTQLILNTLWSIIFFGMHAPFYALIEIVLLWGFIIATTISFYPISKPAAYLMIPYILWVSFAAVLNFSIYWLNR
jgi:benzodiazapine receptor